MSKKNHDVDPSELAEAIRYFGQAPRPDDTNPLEDLTDEEIIEAYHKALTNENMEPAN